MSGAGAAGVALSVLGGVVEAYGQYQSAEAERAAARMNAKLARQQAAQELVLGWNEAGRVRQKGTQLIAEQQVAMGANNADLSSESALDLVATARATNAIDVSRTKANAARRAWALEAEGKKYDYAAEVASLRGKVGVASSILGAAGKLPF